MTAPDFTVSETQRELAELTRGICIDQLDTKRRRAVDAQPVHLDAELWSALATAGVVSAALPDSIGGGGLDFLEQCSVLVELGRAVAPVPYLTHVLASSAIAHFGTDAQRVDWAVPAAEGRLLLTCALGEELADSAAAPLTRAERSDERWCITGSKALVPFGGVADAFLVPATTESGPALFVVLAGDDGVTVTAQRIVDGDEESTLDLIDVSLDDDRRVPGDDVVHWLVARMTVALAAYQVGVLERAVELSAAYARERQQFGRAIGSFQAVAQRLADAYIDVDAVRLTTWEAAWRIAAGLSCPTEIATAKFWAAEAGHRVAHTAVHVHGGTGIDMDGDLHRYFTAAKRTEFTLGGATAQLLLLGAQLAADPV